MKRNGHRHNNQLTHANVVGIWQLQNDIFDDRRTERAPSAHGSRVLMNHQIDSVDGADGNVGADGVDGISGADRKNGFVDENGVVDVEGATGVDGVVDEDGVAKNPPTPTQ